MIDQVPGAKGFFPFRKVEWDLREAIAVLAVAIARLQGLEGPFGAGFDQARFEKLVEIVGQGIKVNALSSGWYYTGPLRTVRDATSQFSSAVESGDLRQRPNYKYSTAEMIRWTSTLDIDLTLLLPEFCFPAIEEVAEHFKVKAEARQQEVEQRRKNAAATQNGSVITINGPVQSVNQGNESVSQTFNYGSGPVDLTGILEVLRQVAHDSNVPDSERRALEVAVEQVERNAEKPIVQSNWLQVARDTIQAVGGIPAAVTAAKMIGTFLGTHLPLGL